MENESILIFGDSYSTFHGQVPEGFDSYYPREGDWGVSDVSKTWWGMLAEQTGSDIVLNNSWSGSTICNTGYDGDCSETSSFICRLSNLVDEGFFYNNKIDRVIIFGGTNDSWTGNAAGELIFNNWNEEHLKQVLPRISYFVSMLLGIVSKDTVHFVINTDLREEIRNGIIEICKYYEIGYTVLFDIEKIDGHPTYAGMINIKNQILSNLGYN